MENPQPRPFYAGGFLYDAATRRVLLHLRDDKTPINPNKWAFFGGGNEGSETPLACFVRELKEEIGLDVDPKHVVALCDYLNEKADTWRYIFVIHAFVQKDSLILAEGAGFEWVSLDDLEQYDLTEAVRRDLKLFESGLT